MGPFFTENGELSKVPASGASFVESHRIGRYALVKLIGRGGMADVWIGKAYGASGFEKIVAVKLLAPYNVDKEEYQRALTDEARVLVHLKHPNIVDVYDLNFEAENPYLVMEFVEGTELRDLLRALRAKKKTLPLPLANYIAGEVAKALSHAHERKDPQTGHPLQIVHRDVSPSNILISSQGEVKLTDFGIAKSALQSGHTQVGLIKGKFRYMSPEQAEGRLLDGRSDMFSLGLVYYECLFGTPAYDDASDLSVLQMARSGRVRIPEECTPEIGRILIRLMAPRPEERYPDLTVFRREFAEGMTRRGWMGDRESLADFLGTVNLPQLTKASEMRRHAEDWDPQPTSQILTERGTIETLAEEMPRSRRRWLYGIGGVTAAGIIVAFLLSHLWGPPTPSEVSAPETRPVAVPISLKSINSSPTAQGSLVVQTIPADAMVQVKYGENSLTRPAPVSLSDIPFGIPVDVTATKKGFKTVSRRLTLSPNKAEEKMELTLQEIKGMRVRFVAEPYAAVTVPGVFTNIETPIASRTLPPGDYDVVFYHAPTKKRITAKLKGKDGGSYLCSANMAVGSSTASPAAFCRSK